MDELLPEPEKKPEATVEAPVPRRNKRKKVGGPAFFSFWSSSSDVFSFTSVIESSAVCKRAHTGSFLCPH